MAAQAKLEAAAIERMNSVAATEYEAKVMTRAEAAMDKAISEVMNDALAKLDEI